MNVKGENFDNLSRRFQRNIYQGTKGKIRLEVLERDFQEFVEKEYVEDARVLDAGGGQGQFSLLLAKRGARISLCDISANMLQAARENFYRENLQRRVEFRQIALQDIAVNESGTFSIILCHAVAEWLPEPQDVFTRLLPLLKRGGYFSLVFYNFYGLEYKNLLRTNFKGFNRERFRPNKGSLTPTSPLKPEEVLQMAQREKLQVVAQSGIRVFHDYIFNRENREREPELLLQKELQYSQLDPFWKIARYVHFLFKRTAN